MGKYKILLSNTVIFALGIGLSKVIISLMLPLYTRTMTTAELGNAELIANLSKLAIPICTAAISSAVFRFGMTKEYHTNDVIKCGTIIMCISTLVLAFFSFFLFVVPSLKPYRIYFFLITGLSMFRLLYSSFMKSIGKNLIFSVDVVLYNIILAVTGVFLLTVGKMGITGYLYAMIIAGFCSLLFLLFSGKIANWLKSGKWRLKLVGKMLRYSFPLVFTDISWALISVTDKLMITNKLAESENGIYSAAAKIPMVLSLFVEIFTGAWVISAIQEDDKEGRDEFYGNVFVLVHFIMVEVTLVLFTINNSFIPWVMGKEFFATVYYTPLLLFGALMTGYSGYFSSLFSAAKATKHIMISTICGVVINIVLNAFLIPQIGVYGACLATIISSAIISSYRMIVSRKYYQINIELPRWVLSIILVILSLCCVVLNWHSAIVAGISILLVGLLYFRYIENVIKKIKGKLEKRKDV